MIALLLALCCSAEPLSPDLTVGTKVSPYSFLVATGPDRGKQTCYVCEQGAKPTAVIFTRVLTEPVGKLLSKLDAEAAAHKEAGFKVWLTQLAGKADLETLAKWSKTQGITTAPVGVYEDADGPPAYKLHADAEVTVVLFAKQKVVACFSFRAGDFTEKRISTVFEALPGLFADKAAAKE